MGFYEPFDPFRFPNWRGLVGGGVEPFEAQAFSLDFDGATEKMESVAALLGIANVFTLGGWVKPNSLGVSGTLGGFVPSTSTPNAVGLYHRHAGPTGPNGIQLLITDSGGLIVQNVAWPNVLSGGVKWYHVLMQWDGITANRKLFIDGVDQGAPSFTQTNTAGTLTDTSRIVLFGGAASGVPAFAGRQAAWQAWDKILGTLEITDVFNSGSIDFNLAVDSGNYASAADLQHWWELGKNVSPDLGQDSGVATAIDVEAAAVGITDADRVADVP